jgi:hypothetical protein
MGPSLGQGLADPMVRHLMRSDRIDDPLAIIDEVQ